MDLITGQSAEFTIAALKMSKVHSMRTRIEERLDEWLDAEEAGTAA